MPKKIKVFISAPYSLGDVAVNINKVVRVANQLLDEGYVPYVPHLTHLWHLIIPRKIKDWFLIDNTFLEHCDYIIRLPGKSAGADNEVKLAKKMGVKFTTLKKLLLPVYGEMGGTRKAYGYPPVATLKDIIDRLDKIEKFLKDEFPQKMCEHDWFVLEGTAAQNLRQCRKCGATEHNPIYKTL